MKKSLVLFLALVLVFSLTASVFAYTDVEEGYWAKEYIERWTEEEVVDGYSDGSFKPDESITRAEFIKIIVETFKPEKEGDISIFSDVNPNAWYADYIAKALGMGAVKGYEDGTFRPNAKITRQEAIVILNRILKMTSKGGEENIFEDADEVASWAEDDVAAFVAAGYVNGYEDNTVRPEGYISRAETVKILGKAIGKIIKEAGEYDLADVEGNVIVRCEGVTLTNTGDRKVFVSDKKVADSLKTDIEDKDDIIDLSAEEKPSSNGGGSSSTSKKLDITITDAGERYTITVGKDVAEGSKFNLKVLGTTTLSGVVLSEDNLAEIKEALVDAANDLDEDKIIKTLDYYYATVPELKELGRITIESYTTDEDERAAARLALAAELPISEVYEALGLSNFKGNMITVLEDVVTYDQIKSIANELK